MLGVAAGHSVVFEDAESGIQGAKAADMMAIAVPNQFTQDHDFSQADLVVPSLEYIDLEMLQNLMIKQQH